MDYYLLIFILSVVLSCKCYVYGDFVVFVRFLFDYYVIIYILRVVF